MDANEQITRFQEFFENNYKTALANHIIEEKHAIEIEHNKLAEEDKELAENILLDPENYIKAAELAIEQFDFGKENTIKRVRIKNLPKSQNIYITNIRSKHLDQLISIEGIVRQASEVRPQVTSAKFECPACGQTMSILQLESKFREPTRCSCGRKGKFRMLTKELVDAQHLKIEESPENLHGGEQPKRLSIFLQEDLVDPKMERRTTPGSKVRICGVVKEIPIMLKTGAQSIRYDIVMEANHIEPVQEGFDDIILTKEEEEEIETFAKDEHAFEKITKAIAPSIYGYEKIKEALVLQLFGGSRKVKKDGTVRRGDIHILLVGDPGCGKCLSGETKITLSNGDIVSIKELVRENEFNKEYTKIEGINLPTLDFNGQITNKNATKVWTRYEKDNLLEIKLRSGKILKVTKNHPLFFSHEGYIIAKEAREFKIKEKIATPRKIEVEAEIQLIDSFKPILKTNAKKNKYPEIVDATFARVCGYLCGDGRIAPTETSDAITLTNCNDEILTDYTKKIEFLFERKPKIRQRNGTTDLTISSKQILAFFEKEFPELVKKAARKEIPKKILKSPNKILAEFVSSLFECDSHINPNKRQIEYCTISKELAENIQLSLLRFGIVAFLKVKQKCATNTEKKRKVTAYEVIISGEFVKEYEKNINYISTKKRKALKNIINQAAYNTNRDIIPGINKFLKKIRKENNLTQKEMGIPRPTYAHFEQNNRLPSRTTLQKITKNLKISENTQRLNQVAHADIFWDEIMEIKESKETDSLVYDLEIDTTHNYIANGIMVHNSQLLQFISKAAPKARFVSGKGSSGAGLTASVVKDEFLRGWSLEAGAIVLANKGIICVDELDKMSHEDRSALHEALEQQSYHPETEIMFSDGSTEKIGKLVDELMKKNKTKIIKGKDCDILPTNHLEVLSTDFQTIYHTKINRVSRHKAPKHFIEITYSNGRKIQVTPEHPIFTVKKGKIKEIPAEKIKANMRAPAPGKLPIKAKKGQLIDRIKQTKKQNHLPKEIEKNICNDLRLVKIKKVQKIENKDCKWVYDVTVEPNQTFISEGLILHNTVTISKANIQATLRAETTMLAAANPKLSRFDPFTPVANQIDLPSTLINRFDLIFPIRDIPDKQRDAKIATHVLEKTESDELYETEVTKEFLRKYLAYARSKVFPKLSKAAIQEIKSFYVTLRNTTQSGDAALKPIPISARQLEALVRLAEAHARIRLDETVSRQDALNAIELLKSYMMEVNYDHETGSFDIDRGSTGITTATRNKIITVRTLINELEATGLKQIPIEEIIAQAAQKGIDAEKVEEALDKLKRSGDIFEPQKGFIQKI